MVAWHEQIEGFQHDSKRLPISHPLRLQRHDLKLWIREESKARENNVHRIRCPCSHCGGGRTIKLANVSKHLSKYGRHFNWRTCAAGEGDSSDEEWGASFSYYKTQMLTDRKLLDIDGAKSPSKIEPFTKPQLIFPEESTLVEATPGEATPTELNPAEMNPTPTNVLPWNPAQRYPASWNPAPWNPNLAPWTAAPPNPTPWTAAPWYPQSQQWVPGFAYPQQWGPPSWCPSQYFRGVEAPFPQAPWMGDAGVWPTGLTFGQGEGIGMEKGAQPACTETSSARPALDAGKQMTDRAGNRSWKDQAAKCQEPGLKRHKRDRRTLSPTLPEFRVECSTPQAFGTENAQNPTFMLGRIETKIARMEMVIDGLETAMEGITEKMDKMVEIAENIQKSVPFAGEINGLGTISVQGILHVDEDSGEPETALLKVDAPILEDDQRQLDIGPTYLSKFASAMVRYPVETGSDDEEPDGGQVGLNEENEGFTML